MEKIMILNKRNIGMDFLDYVKKKPKGNNIFLSTQKTGSEWSSAPKFDEKKIRPNSAQSLGIGKKLRNFDDIFAINDDLGAQITPINEAPDEATNRISDELYIRQSKPEYYFQDTRRGISDNNEDMSINKMQPVYDIQAEYMELKRPLKSSREKDKEDTKIKRKSRSKNRKNKASEERKTPKNRSIDQPRTSNHSKVTVDRKSSLSRPFSGGNERPLNNQKASLKPNKPRQRPKTAKVKPSSVQSELKSPSKNVVSPRSSKKSASRKSKTRISKAVKSNKKAIKGTSKNRKTSLSPSAPIHEELEKKVFPYISRKSMNDLTKAEKQVSIKIELQQTHLVTIQKYMRGYKVYKDIDERRANFKSIKSLKSSSSDEDTLARATNQNDILSSMQPKKPSKEILPEEIKDINKAQLEIIQKVHKAKVHRKKAENDNLQSKSITSFEKLSTNENKRMMKDTISLSLKLLKKKRPFSAKNKETEEEVHQETSQEFKLLKEKLKSFKPSVKKTKADIDAQFNVGKPPISDRSKRNNTGVSKQSSVDSGSERISNISPTTKTFSTEKYQEILNKHIYEDYLKESNYVKEQLNKKKREAKALLDEQKISANSFEQKKRKYEMWAVKKQKNIDEKKNKILSTFGNLGDFADIIKSTKVPPRRIQKNPSLSDSEIKLSEDISQSELSQRHKKSLSNYLKNEGRNHIQNDGRYPLLNKVKNKAIDNLNLSKENNKMEDRYSKLEILQDKDQSFSSKGPVMIKNFNNTFTVPDDGIDAHDDKTGRRSEILANTDLDHFHHNELEDKSSELKEFLKNKLAESQKSKREDDLIGYPSGDEASNKHKQDTIKDLDSIKSDDDAKSNPIEEPLVEAVKPQSPRIEPEKLVDVNIDRKSIPKTILKSEGDEWPSGFPSIAESVTSLDEHKLGKLSTQNLDLNEDILNTEARDSL